MTHLLDTVGSWAPALVFLLAAAESAAFLGLVVPGEVAVILGGVAAGTGRTSLTLVAIGAIGGAVVGDSIGYWLGHRVGPAIFRHPRLAGFGSRLESAQASLGRHGWWALVIARFTSLLRAVVPFAAGMARMSYRTFLLGNAVGGVLWGATFTLVGYLAGNNYPTVERWFRTGGLILAAILVGIGLLVWATRWVSRHREVVLRRVRPLLESAAYRRLVAFLDTGPLRAGMVLWPAALALLGAVSVFGLLIRVVLGNGVPFFDSAIVDQVAAHPIGWLNSVARAVDAAGGYWFAITVATVSVGVGISRRRPDVAAAGLLAVGGQWLIVEATQALVGRKVPLSPPLVVGADYGFPSERLAALAAALVVATWPWVRRSWSRVTIELGAAALLVGALATARVLLLLEYPSDVVAGAAVGTAWGLAVCALADLPRRTARLRTVGEVGEA